MALDCILWKLPIAKLFAVGCVWSSRHKLYNAHKNRALIKGGFVKHNIEYYPTIFNVDTRQVWALHHPSNVWKQMPHLNFLPYGVNKMLCGNGGLILLHGGVQPYSLRTIEKHSFKTNRDPTSIKSNHWTSKYPPQPMLVLVNHIVRNYLVLPPLEMVLTHVLAHITVSALSDSYIIHLVGWKKTHNDTMGVLKVGVYNSIGKEWHFHPDLASNNPLTKSFQPDFVFALSLRSLCRMLPMVYCSDGPLIFVVGKIEAVGDEFNEEKKLVPAVMRYIFQTRSWESDFWPLAETMEAPQIVECKSNVYFVSRTLARPRTLHIYKLVDYDLNQTKFFKGCMDLIKVSTMNHDMYSKCFLDFNSVEISTQYCCIGVMECIWIMCHTLPVIVYYNVERHFWEYIPSIPLFEPGKTVIGNWMYQPSIHAQVL
nr:uncharacterized protein LOC112293320 [Physcomitrium patens]|eukprot:XP_024398363.1 uncharacterized protein LOC112293320 [Physcomitrella patens]